MTADSFSSPSAAFAKKGVTSVSFALFGTVLLRRCLGLEGVYERTLQLAPVPDRLKLQPDTFIQHRTLAQNMLRIDRAGGTKDAANVSLMSGVTIEDIYRQFAAPALNLPTSIRPQLVEAELAAEQELAYVNPDFRPLYDEARRLGRRVGIVAESRWSTPQLRRLLARAAPGLAFDFIYSSADPAMPEAGGLFPYYLRGESLKPVQAVHVGVDEDTVAQSAGGVTQLAFDLPADPWESLYKREETAARLLAMSDAGFHWRLDGGLRQLRRLALAELAPSAPHLAVAAAVLGPVMVGFQRLVEDRVAQIVKAAGETTTGGKVKVMFLARDGFLPMRVWSAANAPRAEYVEVNRRIAMIAASEGEGGFDTLRGLLRGMPFLKARSVEEFFKIKLSKKARDFFSARDDGMVTGEEFAEAMTTLLGRHTIKKLSDNLRAGLMEYLRAKLGDLSGCTDMVLVDIGYTGNIQKGLRRVFDVEKLPIRLHGIYLMPHGEAFVELPGEDTVAGYLDDTVMTPGAKRALMRDAPLIEEFCCAPVGSTRGYANGKEVREEDVRLPEEIAFCLEMQDECVRYHDAFRAVLRRHGGDPLARFDIYRAWTAAILARFVMLPTPLECQTFGPLLHDVSLGSRGLIATITTSDIKKLMGALPFAAVCSIHHPPVWLGGSLAAHTAAAGFAYAATGFGLGADEVLRDVEVGELQAMLFKGEQSQPVMLPVASALTPFGDLRLRIPVLQKDAESVVALPLSGHLTRGVLRSMILQTGDDIAAATTTRYGTRLPMDGVQAVRGVFDGNFFRAAEPEAFLLVPVPAFKQPVGVLAILVTPLFNE